MVSERLGPTIGIVGSILLLLFAFFAFWGFPNIVSGIELVYIKLAYAAGIGIAGIIGGIIARRGMRYANIVLLVGGVAAIVGMFLPIGVIIVGYPPTLMLGFIPQTLFSTWIYVDVVLMCLGGLLGLVIKGE
jgi:hypothetical protein